MKYWLPAIYTTTMFGFSILLWFFLPTIAITASMEGSPFFLIHPLFALEFSMLLSIVIIWIVMFVFFLHNLQKQTGKPTAMVKSNLFEILLIFGTLIVASSGCFFFSQVVQLPESTQGDLWVTQGVSKPRLFSYLYGIGIIFCEPAWIITILSKYLRH